MIIETLKRMAKPLKLACLTINNHVYVFAIDPSVPCRVSWVRKRIICPVKIYRKLSRYQLAEIRGSEAIKNFAAELRFEVLFFQPPVTEITMFSYQRHKVRDCIGL